MKGLQYRNAGAAGAAVSRQTTHPEVRVRDVRRLRQPSPRKMIAELVHVGQ
jgi:hypothetical protein